ncbi:serine hydrolase [Aquimarina algiphila]|uniref:serine hydrolase n=1 Tax=Aquimarina algiphila TaxID=2047982 RepID=UPI00232D4D55|nr:serine hydrolase [Aquimarina algiphila]
MKQFNLLIFTILILLSKNIQSQVSKNSTLFKELKSVDSLFFEEGFNKCNFQILEKYIPSDFEFYHDENGVQNREQFIKGFKESICSNTEKKPIRKVVKESLQVFRLKNNGETYGAIQKGVHLFYIKEPNKRMYLTNIAKFTSVWNIKNGQWKLSRVLSYDHKEPKADYGSGFNANYPIPLFENDKEVEALLKKHKIPSISIGLIQQGKVSQIRTFGFQQDTIKTGINSIYKVASLTKPVVANVVLKLVDMNKLNLDEPLSKYYVDNDLKGHPFLTKLTARNILTHQSGLPNWRYLTKNKKLSFLREPGIQWEYSGEGFEYLRKAIESKLQKPLEVIAQELLFVPLEMRNTSFYWTSDVNEDRYAVEHDENGKKIAFKKYTKTNAAANLLTTTEDYSKFLVHILNGAGISRELYQEFIKPQSKEKEGIFWGLGIQILPNLNKNETVLMHTGGDYGTKTLAIISLKSKKGLVVFANSENGMILWNKLLNEYLPNFGAEIMSRNMK